MFTGIFKRLYKNTYCILRNSPDINIKKVTVMISSVMHSVKMAVSISLLFSISPLVAFSDLVFFLQESI